MRGNGRWHLRESIITMVDLQLVGENLCWTIVWKNLMSVSSNLLVKMVRPWFSMLAYSEWWRMVLFHLFLPILWSLQTGRLDAWLHTFPTIEQRWTDDDDNWAWKYIYIYSTPLHVTSLNILVKNFEKLSAYLTFLTVFVKLSVVNVDHTMFLLFPIWSDHEISSEIVIYNKRIMFVVYAKSSCSMSPPFKIPSRITVKAKNIRGLPTNSKLMENLQFVKQQHCRGLLNGNNNTARTRLAR